MNFNQKLSVAWILVISGLTSLVSAWLVHQAYSSASLQNEANTLTMLGLYFLCFAIIAYGVPLLRKHFFRQPKR